MVKLILYFNFDFWYWYSSNYIIYLLYSSKIFQVTEVEGFYHDFIEHGNYWLLQSQGKSSGSKAFVWIFKPLILE